MENQKMSKFDVTCHCKKISLSATVAPDSLTSCNCSICNRLGVTSHGLALFMLEGADDDFGIACLGGECFGEAGAGFLRFSCAEPNDRLEQALAFIPEALSRTDRLEKWLAANPQYKLTEPYNES